VATVSVLRSVSLDFGELYRALMQYSRIHSPIANLVDLLNRPIDVRTNKAANRERRKVTKAEREKVVREARKDQIVDDMVPIKLVDVSFSWKPQRPDKRVFENLRLEVPQGTCVAITSNGHHQGRNTLLRLIGQLFQPTSGQVFIPMHLRVLHVSNQPMMIEAPIWDNLTFGAKETPRERVYQILEDMNMYKTLKEVRKEAGEGSPTSAAGVSEDRWQISFPYSELAKIHLARAFIMSPEVCVMQRPFSHFTNSEAAEEVLAMIRSMVRDRGVRLPPESAHRRRPRTCFVTPEEEWQAEVADQVWKIQDHRIDVRRGKLNGQ